MITFTNNGINTSILDYDAREFIRVAKLTDETQIRAINELCKDLKVGGFWDRIWKAYPFVYNGTTASMMVELKSRTSASIQTTPFIAGLPYSDMTPPTLSSTGIKFNGGSALNVSYGYSWTIGGTQTTVISGGTKYNDLPAHICFYSRTSSFPSGQKFGGVKWYGNPGSNGYNFQQFWSGNNYVFTCQQGNHTALTASTPGYDGLFIYSNSNDNGGLTASSTNPYLKYLSRNGQILKVHSVTLSWSDRSFGGPILLSNNFDGAASGSTSAAGFTEYAWWSMGGGDPNTGKGGGSFIPDIQSQDFYNVIQKFQTTLGRQV